jgi:hypothetical protein
MGAGICTISAFCSVTLPMKMKTGITTLFLLFAFLLKGQTMAEAEIELTRLGKKTIEAKTEEERLAAADTFALQLDATISKKAAFEYPFEAVKNLSKLISPDKNFRIYTWSVPLRNGSFTFYGRLLTQRMGKQTITVLTDGGSLEEKPEFKLLKPEQWFGAVYYDIIKTKNKKDTYYTLLGYRPNNNAYHQKVVEVISGQNLQRLRFGDKIFNTPIFNSTKMERPPYRLVLRYNPKAVSLLRWIPEEKYILMDHLSPPDASQNGDWKLYGPDFSYDALTWTDGLWQLNEAVFVKGDAPPTAPQPETQKGLIPKK